MNLVLALKVFFVAGVLSMASSLAVAKDDSYEKKKSCVDKLNQRTAAMVAEDWEKLSQLSERYLKACKNTFGDHDYSNAYRDLILASLKLGNAKRAVSVGDTCINFYYSNAGCHIWRVEGLLALNRTKEAKTSLEKTEKLISHLIQTTKGELPYANQNIDIELINAKLYELNAQQAQAESIRRLFF